MWFVVFGSGLCTCYLSLSSDYVDINVIGQRINQSDHPSIQWSLSPLHVCEISGVGKPLEIFTRGVHPEGRMGDMSALFI